MKIVLRLTVFALVILIWGCGKEKEVSEKFDKNSVKKEIETQFNQFIIEINKKDADKWADFYSVNDFISASVMTETYNKRDEWIALIKSYFTQREKQVIRPTLIEVTPLNSELGLTNSKEISNITLKDGTTISSIHSFSILWKKECEAWRIIQSHESWINK